MNKIEFGTYARRISDNQLIYIVGSARDVSKTENNEVIIFAILGENGFMTETCVQDKNDFMETFEKV